MRKKELFSRNLIENKRRMPQRPLEVVSDFVIEKMPQLIKPLLAALIIAVALVPVLSLVMADVEQLGPLELTDGSYTSNTQPEFEFLLSYEEEGFPLSYRIEVADAPDNWSGDSNSRVIRYDLGGIEEEDLATPFFFTVGQAEGEDGDYGDGGPDQTLADGSYWWRVRTTDDDGIESAWVTAGIETEGEEVPAFIVDTTPPVINNIELVGDGPTSETTVEVTGTATDATGTVENVQFKVDSNTNGGWTDCVADDETFDQAQENFSCTVTDLDDGESEIYLRASDNTGNQTDVEDRPFQTVLVVTQGPEFPSGLDSTPEPGVWFNEDEISISWEAAESAGVDLAGYYWVFDTNSNTDPSDGDSFLNSAALGHTLEDVPNGDEHWFHIRAVDELDNLGETVHIGPFFIDTEDPTEPSTPETTVASPLNTNTPTWEWDASDDEFSDISHYVAEWSQDETFDDGITEIFTAPTADEVATFTHTTELDDGTWFFRVYAVDNAGNESSPSDPGSVLIDTQDPIISELQVAFEEDDPEEGTQQATVSWETDKPTTATIEYGFTTEYGTQDESLILDTEHSFDLPGLLACTTYLYEISVTDAVDNSATLDSLEFTTPGCVGSAEPISQISQEIAPGGGEIEFTGEEDSVLLTLDIPADFSEESDDVVFQIKQLDAQEVDDETATPTGLSWIGSYAYDLKALAGTDTNITEFDQPISITLYFEATDVSGIDLTTVQIFRWDTSGDDGEWLELDSCGEVTVDPENPDRYSITCETSNFSVFGLFGEEIPEPTPSPTPTPQPSSSSSGSSSGTSAPTVPFCSDTKPSGTPDLFQIDVTNTQATLYFSPATGSVNKYFVAYGYESEQELFGVEFDQGESGGVLSYTVSHLTPNTTYVFKLRAGNGCMPGDWSNEMRVQTGGSDVVTKFYKNFVQQIISSLPRAVSSLTPGTPTSPGSTMIGFDDGTLTETTPEQQESSFSDPSGSSESPSDDASENAEDNGGFWSWLRRWLRRLFGML